MISLGRWVRVGRWWVDWGEARWWLRDQACKILGHRVEAVAFDNGDVALVCRRGCGHYEFVDGAGR